jgi:2-iminobutanoate/2-iminopropanoate deaminase
MERISTNQAPAAIGPYSQAVKTGNMLYLSGQIPLVPETGELIHGGIIEQTEQVLHNIKSVLSAAGSDVSQVVKSTCFLTDMNDFAAFNEVYARHFTGKPARSCIVVLALPRGARVEIEVIAEV